MIREYLKKPESKTVTPHVISRAPPYPPTLKIEKNKKVEKVFCQKLIDFEGFRPNGYHH